MHLKTEKNRLVRPLTARTADAVVVVVPALVSNALRHLPARLTAHPDTIKVAVHDHSHHTPRSRPCFLNLTGRTGGFHLAATATTRPTTGGKTVSALLAR